MEEKDIREICRANHLQCNQITKAYGSFNKELFFIDDIYLMRTSKQSMLDEQTKINRVRNLKHVPKIIHSSEQSSTNCDSYYLILQYIKGHELFEHYNDLKDQEIHNIGVEIAKFLHDLHRIKGEKYDIGHYIPIIPGYDKSWRSGHELYWGDIYNGLNNIQMSEDVRQVLEICDEYIKANLTCLEFENGPSLLHNDFHFKNIIINNNAFSGIIDWECSQFGEADFDLIHLVHWSLFPPSKDFDMKQMFETTFQFYIKRCSIPMIEKRLTIYLLEHDFIQILWSQGKRADELLPRIKWWISSLEEYIQNLLKREMI